MVLKRKFDELLPPYTRIPLLSMMCLNGLVYFATRLVTRNLTHYDLSLSVDHSIPFVPAFVVVYVLSYIQWTVGFILIARDSRELCGRVISGELIAKLICLILFLLVPTTMTRPAVTSDGFFNTIVGYIYKLDAPDNLFPSIHCLESWVCFRGAMQMKKVGPWYRYVTLLFSLSVFASTVLIKQHLAVDIVAGILVAEIGQQIAKNITFIQNSKGWKIPFYKRS